MNRESRRNVPRPYSGTVLIVLITLSLVGCAGGSAKRVSAIEDEDQLVRPPVFLIYNFAVDPEDVMVDTSGLTSGDEASTAERISEGKEWVNALSESLVRQLVEEGITARRAKGSTHIPLNAIAVKGQFIQIDEGDEIKRTTVGFGAGAEEVSVMVQAYQMKKTGLMRISEVEAEAHGRKTPGVAGPAAVAVGAGMVAGLVISSAMNVKSEAVDGSMQTTVDDLAEELVQRTVNYYKKRGWL
jgi:type IV pilus biogenesis protein CpaD/CtpE